MVLLRGRWSLGVASWIPAYAGMTARGMRWVWRKRDLLSGGPGYVDSRPPSARGQAFTGMTVEVAGLVGRAVCGGPGYVGSRPRLHGGRLRGMTERGLDS